MCGSEVICQATYGIAKEIQVVRFLFGFGNRALVGLEKVEIFKRIFSGKLFGWRKGFRLFFGG